MNMLYTVYTTQIPTYTLIIPHSEGSAIKNLYTEMFTRFTHARHQVCTSRDPTPNHIYQQDMHPQTTGNYTSSQLSARSPPPKNVRAMPKSEKIASSQHILCQFCVYTCKTPTTHLECFPITIYTGSLWLSSISMNVGQKWISEWCLDCCEWTIEWFRAR